ncbi:chitin synthase-domain-containing protein [Mycena galopus ATCC 62051]|nr:chitin synthase-domain-containing protein [Mycena galopus ATCC 62051]
MTDESSWLLRMHRQAVPTGSRGREDVLTRLGLGPDHGGASGAHDAFDAQISEKREAGVLSSDLSWPAVLTVFPRGGDTRNTRRASIQGPGSGARKIEDDPPLAREEGVQRKNKQISFKGFWPLLLSGFDFTSPPVTAPNNEPSAAGACSSRAKKTCTNLASPSSSAAQPPTLSRNAKSAASTITRPGPKARRLRDAAKSIPWGAVGDVNIGKGSVVVNGYDYGLGVLHRLRQGLRWMGRRTRCWWAGGTWLGSNLMCLGIVSQPNTSTITGKGAVMDWYLPCNVRPQPNVTRYDSATNCYVSVKGQEYHAAAGQLCPGLEPLAWLDLAHLTVPPLFAELHTPNSGFVNADLTMILMRRNQMNLGHYFCVASQVLLCLSLGGVILMMAETYEQRMMRSAQIEAWSTDICKPALSGYRPNAGKGGLRKTDQRKTFLPFARPWSPTCSACCCRRRWINSTIHNLAELVLVRGLCGKFCFSIQFVVGVELAGTLVLPSSFCRSSRTTPTPVLLAFVRGLPGILIAITSRKWTYVGWMIIYLLPLPIWTGMLPAYAFLALERVFVGADAQG